MNWFLRSSLVDFGSAIRCSIPSSKTILDFFNQGRAELSTWSVVYVYIQTWLYLECQLFDTIKNFVFFKKQVKTLSWIKCKSPKITNTNSENQYVSVYSSHWFAKISNNLFLIFWSKKFVSECARKFLQGWKLVLP